MEVLVDTSVWIRHFQNVDSRVVAALDEDRCVIHPWVIGELAVGRIPKRDQTLEDLLKLRQAPEVAFPELLHLINLRSLFGKGLSIVDCQLLASCLVGNYQLTTDDRALSKAAKQLKIG